MGLAYRLSRLAKRVLLPLAVLLYLCATVFDLHTRNLVNNNFAKLAPYSGGPIEDIKRISCYPWWYGSCNQLVERFGGADNEVVEEMWYRVPKPLDLNGLPTNSRWAWRREFLYVKPSETKGVYGHGKAIVDLVIGSPQSSEPPEYVIRDAQTSIGRPKSRLDITYNYNNWDLRPDGIWVKYDKHSAEDAVTGIQYLFGQDVIEPRDDWRLVPGIMKLQSSSPIRIVIHRKKDTSVPAIRQPPMLKQNADEQFKVLQLSDMHFSSDIGICKDQVADPLVKDKLCKADSKTTNFIHQVLDAEKPQLVVVTGDILDGSNTFDYQTALLKALSPMISRGVPFAFAIGEHDTNKYASRQDIVDFITQLPYSVMVRSLPTQSYHDITNYVLPIYNNEETKVVNAIYILGLFSASHSFPNEPPFDVEQFLKSSYESLPQKPEYSLAFQHFPIQQYRPKDAFPIVGEYNEKHKLKSKTYPDTRRLFSDIGINAMSVGSEHTNECCIKSDGTSEKLNELWMCFGGSVGEGAYGDGKHDRRVRLFRMDTKGKEVSSWKRRQGKPQEVFDYQHIYKG